MPIENTKKVKTKMSYRKNDTKIPIIIISPRFKNNEYVGIEWFNEPLEKLDDRETIQNNEKRRILILGYIHRSECLSDIQVLL